MNNTYVIANWKSNKTSKEALSWIKAVKSNLPKLSKNIKVVICPPVNNLNLFKGLSNNVALGSQNISPYPDGAYTGEISARMLEGQIKFVILGHSERRRYFKETNSRVALKTTQALEYKITPILALDKNNWRSQLNVLKKDEKQKCIIMYEPPEAISQPVGPVGKGKPAPLKEITSMIAKIKKSSPHSPVIYGGSVKSSNLAALLKEPTIEGVLPGSASLNANEFIKMLEITQDIRG